ncbi:MAG: CRISPR-associated helicase Cas3, partial [Candidatus Poribacteria bacterium]|nr:CRISPR-associated helicase Cas3 [Candidatus Poribacteria bacterium]
FPNACFVFDEIHAFEPLLVGLTIATVKWLKTMGAKVLFASATLPLFLEKILEDELGIPLDNIILPDPRREGDKDVLDKTRHAIEIRPGCLLSNIETIIDEIETSQKTALIICNHVATSQAVYEKVRNAFSDVKLLHARFNAEDRFKIEEAIQSKNPPRVLVATQAVEVSLDLDYDCGYIEPAPADALGQRLGRINRKGSRLKPAHVVIFEEPSKTTRGTPLYLPYDENITQRTIGLLNQIKLLSEQKLTDIVNEIYSDGYTGDSKEDYERGLHNQMVEKFTEEMAAGTYRHWIEDVIEGTDGQIEVLPMELYNKFIDLRKEERYLEAKLLFVPIQSRQIKRLFKEGILYWDKQIGEYRTSLKYSSDCGLDLSKQMESIF